VRVLVDLHAVDWQSAGLGEISHPEATLQRQVERLDRSGICARAPRTWRRLSRLSAWLVDRLPPSPMPRSPQRLQAQ